MMTRCRKANLSGATEPGAPAFLPHFESPSAAGASAGFASVAAPSAGGPSDDVSLQDAVKLYRALQNRKEAVSDDHES